MIVQPEVANNSWAFDFTISNASLKLSQAFFKGSLRLTDINFVAFTKHCWSNNNNFKFSEDEIIQKCSSIYDCQFWEAN